VSFWDSSSIVPLVITEIRTQTMHQLRGRAPTVHVWWGTRVECISAIERSLREERIDISAATLARQDLTELWYDAEEIAPTEDVRSRAERCLAVHPLRAADGLQLAAALIWARERPQRMEFVSLDARLRAAAAREGFTVLPATL